MPTTRILCSDVTAAGLPANTPIHFVPVGGMVGTVEASVRLPEIVYAAAVDGVLTYTGTPWRPGDGQAGVPLEQTEAWTNGGWARYRVVVPNVNDNQPVQDFHIHVPASSTAQLADVIAAQTPSGGWVTAGKSAYDLAVENGYTGTASQWLASLKGDPGAASMARGYIGTANIDALTSPGDVGVWVGDGNAAGPLPEPLPFTLSVETANHPWQPTSQTFTATNSGRRYVRSRTDVAPWTEWRRVDQQDTGWRNVTGLVPPASLAPGNSGQLFLRRQGSQVTCNFEDLAPAPGSGHLAILDPIPAGFQPRSRAAGRVTAGNSLVHLSDIIAWEGGLAFSGKSMVGGGDFERPSSWRGQFSWETSDPEPPALPGTPA